MSPKACQWKQKLVSANIINLAHIFVSGTNKKVVHYEQDIAFQKHQNFSFQFLRLVESHYENLPFIIDVRAKLTQKSTVIVK